MNTLTLTVTGMSCMGCVNSVKNLLSELPSVADIQIDLASGRVALEHDPNQADRAAICQAIRNGGYQVQD